MPLILGSFPALGEDNNEKENVNWNPWRRSRSTAGEEGILETEGVFELPPAESAAIAQGVVVYATPQGKITTTQAENARAGIAWADRSLGESLVRVKINF